MQQTLEKRTTVVRKRKRVRRLSQPVLPPPKKTTLSLDDDPVFDQLSRLERAWLEEQVGDAPILYAARTGTRVDVGHWLTNGRVWALAGKKELILLAAGKRPFAERADLIRLRQSMYNHLTGELVLAPAETLMVKKLKVKPLEGLQLLAQVFGEGKKNA